MIKNVDSYIVMSVAAGMTVACGFWLYQPGQRELSSLIASAQAMREQLARGSSAVNELANIKTDVSNANELLNDYQTRITPTPKVGAFIEQVSSVASQLGLQGRKIIPQSPKENGSIVMLPIDISFESAFDKSFDFLRSIERLPRAVQVTHFTIKRVDGDDSVAAPYHKDRPQNLLRTELTLQIFFEAT